MDSVRVLQGEELAQISERARKYELPVTLPIEVVDTIERQAPVFVYLSDRADRVLRRNSVDYTTCPIVIHTVWGLPLLVFLDLPIEDVRALPELVLSGESWISRDTG